MYCINELHHTYPNGGTKLEKLRCTFKSRSPLMMILIRQDKRMRMSFCSRIAGRLPDSCPL
jgi:hypothetical protein